MKKVNAEFERIPGSVFVNVACPKPVPQSWTAVASEIATQMPTEASPQEERAMNRTTTNGRSQPTAEELLAAYLPRHIEASRWGRYISPGPASHIFDGTIFVYHDPCDNFWDLYELSKGIFRDLGIKLSKPKGVWVANIPIKVLTDKVFVNSGLAAVEKTLLAGTGIDPVKILEGIRHRQLAETKQGMAKVKRLRESLADAAGVVAITAISWFAYVVMGGVA